MSKTNSKNAKGRTTGIIRDYRFACLVCSWKWVTMTIFLKYRGTTKHNFKWKPPPTTYLPSWSIGQIFDQLSGRLLCDKWLFKPRGLASPGNSKKYSQTQYLLGGWTNLFERIISWIGSFPQIGVKIENLWKPPPSNILSNLGTYILRTPPFFSYMPPAKHHNNQVISIILNP